MAAATTATGWAPDHWRRLRRVTGMGPGMMGGYGGYGWVPDDGRRLRHGARNAGRLNGWRGCARARRSRTSSAATLRRHREALRPASVGAWMTRRSSATCAGNALEPGREGRRPEPDLRRDVEQAAPGRCSRPALEADEAQARNELLTQEQKSDSSARLRRRGGGDPDAADPQGERSLKGTATSPSPRPDSARRRSRSALRPPTPTEAHRRARDHRAEQDAEERDRARRPRSAPRARCRRTRRTGSAGCCASSRD